MARRPHFWNSWQWRRMLLLDGDRDLAEAEGLAAGTGLLTGDTARQKVDTVPCPICTGVGDVVVIDLVARVVSRRCQSCGHRWDTDEPARNTSARR